jgi:hypothetical protein
MIIPDLMDDPPLSPASGMEIDVGDEYDRMLEDENEYPEGFWDEMDQLEHQYVHYVFFNLKSISDAFPTLELVSRAGSRSDRASYASEPALRLPSSIARYVFGV